jgi:hypothetical protein
MKRYAKTLLAAFLLAGLVPAFAQVAGPVGQTAGGGIDPTTYLNNSDSAGFNEMAVTPAMVIAAGSTAQATFTRGAVLTGQVITTRTTVITTCSGTTGPTLPAVQRYVPITLVNRSGGSCLIWPSVGAALETALGTTAAANAPFTMLTNTDVTFRPTVVGTTVTWYQ